MSMGLLGDFAIFPNLRITFVSSSSVQNVGAWAGWAGRLAAGAGGGGAGRGPGLAAVNPLLRLAPRHHAGHWPWRQVGAVKLGGFNLDIDIHPC